MKKGNDPIIEYDTNQVSKISSQLGKVPLKLVKRISFCGHLTKAAQINELPELLLEMPLLERIEIIDCHLTNFPIWMNQLKTVRSIQIVDSKKIVDIDHLFDLPLLEEFSYMVNGSKILHTIFEFVQKSNIQYFHFRDDELTTIPAKVEHLKNLVGLHISSVKLKTVSNGLCLLKNLKKLSIGGDFSALPSKIGALSNLESLKLYWCDQLKQLPKSISKLSQLKQLKIENTGIKKLPENFEALTKMEILELNGNELETFPFNIDHWVNLRELDLGYNQLEELPLGIQKLTKLDFVSFEGNLNGLHQQILETCAVSFSKMKIEKPMSAKQKVSANPIELSIDLEDTGDETLWDWLGKTKRLKHLSLKAPLSKLPHQITKLQALESLELECEEVFEFPENIGNLKALKSLFFYSNSILEKLPSSFFELKGLQKATFYLKDGNQLQIPTNLKELSITIENSELSDNFTTDFQLKRLAINSEKLEYLPSSLVSLPLSNLTLNTTQLHANPETMIILKQLQGLTYLKLSMLSGYSEETHQIATNLNELLQVRKLILLDFKPDLIPNLENMQALEFIVFEKTNAAENKAFKNQKLPNGGKGWRISNNHSFKKKWYTAYEKI